MSSEKELRLALILALTVMNAITVRSIRFGFEPRSVPNLRRTLQGTFCFWQPPAQGLTAAIAERCVHHVQCVLLE